MVEATFSNFRKGFSKISPKLQRVVHENTLGMRLWIGTSTINENKRFHFKCLLVYFKSGTTPLKLA